MKTHIEVDYFGKASISCASWYYGKFHFTLLFKTYYEKWLPQIVAINWNPGVEGTLRVRERDAQAYYQAYCKFHRIIRRKELEVIISVKYSLSLLSSMSDKWSAVKLNTTSLSRRE